MRIYWTIWSSYIGILGVIAVSSLFPFALSQFVDTVNEQVAGAWILVGGNILLLFSIAFSLRVGRPYDAQFGLAVVLLLMLSVATIALTSTRRYELGRLAWQCEGPILAKYRSKDHGIGSLVVGGSKGGTFEGVWWPEWSELKIGDHIEKRSMDPYGYINGARVRLVEVGRLRGLVLPGQAEPDLQRQNRALEGTACRLADPQR